MNYWLMKSEPEVFGINHLVELPKRTEHWDGVRNYQARNFMRDEMRKGDLAFFYHSNCATPGIVGTMKIVREGYPDHTALDPKSKYYDARADPARPRWYMVDVQYVRKFDRVVTLAEMKKRAGLKTMRILQRGNRLSITPVSHKEWDIILGMESTQA